MKKLFLVFVFVGIMACAIQGMAEPEAVDYANAFIQAGIPVGNIIEYDEFTDPNGLLGRPGRYTSKVNFEDARLEQTSSDSPEGGTVECFATQTDMESRKKYLEAIRDAAPLFGRFYVYASPDGLALLRVSFDLVPADAAAYESAMIEFCEQSEGFTQAEPLEPRPADVPSDIRYAKTVARALNVRTEASTSSKPVIFFERSEIPIIITGEAANDNGETWFSIEYRNVQGYINGGGYLRADYVEIIGKEEYDELQSK